MYEIFKFLKLKFMYVNYVKSNISDIDNAKYIKIYGQR